MSFSLSSLFSFIVDLNLVFIIFSFEKDLSTEQLDTGRLKLNLIILYKF